jgi:(R,R)-butanediol dehydrogenase / meso-butanediol dehydrogenase / diacetyl reductase
MRALRWHGRRDIRLDDVSEPTAARGEVLIRVAACGICGSDLHEYLDGPVYIPRAPHPLTGVAPPVTLGHEFCGRIVTVGPEVTGVREGDRVAVNPCLLCGACPWCRRGQPNLCARLATLGLSRDGGFASLVSVPAYGCHVLPPAIDDRAGAFVEPLAVAVHAARRARVAGGERAAIVGGGPVGLLLLQVLRARGLPWIAVVEPREDRRRLARDLGAAAVLDPGAGDPARALAELTGELRADLAFECVGNEKAFATAVRLTGKGGRVVLVGLVPAPVPVNLLALLAHEKEIVGSSAYTDEFPAAVGLLAEGRVRVDGLITGEVALEDSLTHGLFALTEPAGGHVKILVRP